MFRQTVSSGDVELAVWASGATGLPTIVAVHGFPDTHAMWDPVAKLLSERFRVVTYDVRGAGESAAPARRDGYAMSWLVDDLVAVLDATVGPAGQAHLVGHDWGSVQLWEALLRERSDRRLAGRLASFTSISGPGLGQVAAFFRSARRPGRLLPVAAQLVRSAYIPPFCLPVLPNIAMGLVAGRTGANGVNLYGANIRRAPLPPRTRPTVPVQLIVATRDPFLRPVLYADSDTWADQVERVDIDAGHWAPRTHAREIAELVSGFVDRQASGP
jgi:pimeloyl-ACP methyl ester carboxylesterase